MLTTQDKFKKLQNILKEMESVLVAFSGGTDSTFLLKVAHEILGEKAVAASAVSQIQPSHEKRDARRFADKMGIKHILMETDEMQDNQFISNPPERCYICKKRIFSEMKKKAAELGLKEVIDGTNVDDQGDYRPGLKALKELKIRSPLKEADFTKQEIREMSRLMRLPTWNVPSLACLASRIPYGEKITSDKLEQVDLAETFIRQLGYKQVRVRNHNHLARIELPPQDITKFVENGHLAEVNQRLKKIGFTFVTLDIQGYRTGSLNETIK